LYLTRMCNFGAKDIAEWHEILSLCRTRQILIKAFSIVSIH
jgi:hypothetical protein